MAPGTADGTGRHDMAPSIMAPSTMASPKNFATVLLPAPIFGNGPFVRDLSIGSGRLHGSDMASGLAFHLLVIGPIGRLMIRLRLIIGFIE